MLAGFSNGHSSRHAVGPDLFLVYESQNVVTAGIFTRR
jgi:hypothetical protein